MKVCKKFISLFLVTLILTSYLLLQPPKEVIAIEAKAKDATTLLTELRQRKTELEKELSKLSYNETLLKELGLKKKAVDVEYLPNPNTPAFKAWGHAYRLLEASGLPMAVSSSPYFTFKPESVTNYGLDFNQVYAAYKAELAKFKELYEKRHAIITNDELKSRIVQQKGEAFLQKIQAEYEDIKKKYAVLKAKENYIDEVKEINQKLEPGVKIGDYLVQDLVQKSAVLYDQIAKEFDEHYKTIVPKEHLDKMDKNLDLNHLTPEQSHEVDNYLVKLINVFREATGYRPVKLTKKASELGLENAKRVRESDKPGYGDHNQAVLQAMKQEYQVNLYEDLSLASLDWQWNARNLGNDYLKAPKSMISLKRFVYYSILALAIRANPEMKQTDKTETVTMTKDDGEEVQFSRSVFEVLTPITEFYHTYGLLVDDPSERLSYGSGFVNIENDPANEKMKHDKWLVLGSIPNDEKDEPEYMSDYSQDILTKYQEQVIQQAKSSELKAEIAKVQVEIDRLNLELEQTKEQEKKDKEKEKEKDLAKPATPPAQPPQPAQTTKSTQATSPKQKTKPTPLVEEKKPSKKAAKKEKKAEYETNLYDRKTPAVKAEVKLDLELAQAALVGAKEAEIKPFSYAPSTKFEPKNFELYDITLLDENGKKITKYPKGFRAEVLLPVAEGRKVLAVKHFPDAKDSSKQETLPSKEVKIGKKTYRKFTVNHFSIYGIEYQSVSTMKDKVPNTSANAGGSIIQSKRPK